MNIKVTNGVVDWTDWKFEGKELKNENGEPSTNNEIERLRETERFR